MANIDAPFGFLPVGHLLNGQYDGRMRWYNIPAAYGTALHRGDVVKSSGTGQTDGKYGIVEIAAAGNLFAGVVGSIRVDRAVAATEHPGYLPASTGGYVGVIVDPYVVFVVQEDDGTMVITDIGEHANHVAGAGSTTTGLSGMELDSSDAGTGDGFKILGLENREGTELSASSSFANWLVVGNEHEIRGAVAGV